MLTEVGKETRFTYYIKPTILAEDIGFDAVEISTPSGVVSVDSLRLDEVDQQDFSWTLAMTAWDSSCCSRAGWNRPTPGR